MKKQFDGFYIGQFLTLSEYDSGNNFLVEDIIGGGMGVCVKVKNIKTNKVFALKGIQKVF